MFPGVLVAPGGLPFIRKDLLDESLPGTRRVRMGHQTSRIDGPEYLAQQRSNKWPDQVQQQPGSGHSDLDAIALVKSS
jgi:hypothetical protein